MATSSQIKTGLDSISKLIEGAQAQRDTAKSNLLAARNQLNAIPTTFSDVIATINAFTPTGEWESYQKDEKAKLQAEFLALKSDLETELTDLGVPFS